MLLRRALSALARPPELTAVQQTALLTAYCRAWERAHTPKPLCDDPYAHVLVDALLSPSARVAHEQSRLRADGVEIMAVRTRVLDDWLTRVVVSRTAKGQQVVLLGAGMDTRAFRLPLTAATVFEIDSDARVQDAKARVLSDAGAQRTCARLVTVQADLADPPASAAALCAAGLCARTPTHWVVEGLLEYLPRRTHAELFAMAARLGGAPGSTLCAQVLEPSWADRLDELRVQLPYEPLAPVGESVDALEGAGWAPLHVLRRPDFEEMYPCLLYTSPSPRD